MQLLPKTKKQQITTLAALLCTLVLIAFTFGVPESGGCGGAPEMATGQSAFEDDADESYLTAGQADSSGIDLDAVPRSARENSHSTAML